MDAGAFATIEIARQREGSSNYYGENSDEVQLCELQSSKKVRADYYKDNGEKVEVVSREDVARGMSGVEKNEENENHGPHMDQDPLAESIILLQGAQEALEKEIQNFREIGKEHLSLPVSPSCAVSSSAQVLLEEIEESNSSPKVAQLAKLSQKLSLLEDELEEATTILKGKELKVLKLESILNTTRLPKEGTKDNLASLQGMCKEMEMELEDLLKNKIEAEVEYLMMVRNAQDLKIMMEDGNSLLEQQRSLTKNQAQMVVKLKDAEDKATMLKRRAEELEGTKDVLKLHNDVCKFALCYFTQLILLYIAFAFVLLQLLPHSHGVVPT